MTSPRRSENRSSGAPAHSAVILDVAPNRAPQRARRLVLAEAKFCVHDAAGADQAMRGTAAYQPDVVLLDWSEADLCRRLKARFGDIPIVVLLSPSAKPATDLRCCGADLFLPRNLAPALLIEAVKTLLRLRGAEREIERSRRELLDFSMQLTHDIEGPLRGVVTFAEIIGQAHPLSENERTYLGHVLSSADHVRRLTRGVLTYAEARRAQPRLKMIPLRGVVTAALQNLRQRIKESAAVIHQQDPLPSALGDFSAVQEVLQNLIVNAINYRHPESSLSVAIGAATGPSGDCLISVSDNGIGIAKEHHESIFAPFRRLHGLEIPGAGMGLAICKQIVESHGGRIWVESEPGRGASFWFTLRASG
jgi:signal transduction histidine kinase